MLFGLQYGLFSTLLSHDGLFTHRLDEMRECSTVDVDPQCGWRMEHDRAVWGGATRLERKRRYVEVSEGVETCVE